MFCWIVELLNWSSMRICRLFANVCKWYKDTTPLQAFYVVVVVVEFVWVVWTIMFGYKPRFNGNIIVLFCKVCFSNMYDHHTTQYFFYLVKNLHSFVSCFFYDAHVGNKKFYSHLTNHYSLSHIPSKHSSQQPKKWSFDFRISRNYHCPKPCI